MSFFKRKEKNLIPPVPDPISSRGPSPGASVTPTSSYRSNSSTYVASRDGDLAKFSSTPPPQPSYEGRYTRQNAIGDVYSRGEKDINQDRGELFAGYNPEKAGSGRFFSDGPGASRGGEDPAEGEENEEDVEGIKQQLRFTQQESVNSTRNALRLAREAEETARNTLGKLGDQSGMHSLHALPRGLLISAFIVQRNSQALSGTLTFPRATQCVRKTRRTS